MRKHFLTAVVGTVLTLAMATGCESMGMGKKDTASMDMNKGMMATQGSNSMIFLPEHGGGVKTLSVGGGPACAHCKMDAGEYFKTGKMTEKCAACGAVHGMLK